MQWRQKYSRLWCLLRVKGLAICFYLGWSGSILHFRQNIIKVGSKSWLLTCSSNITLSLPLYTGSALKRYIYFLNGYLSLLYFWVEKYFLITFQKALHSTLLTKNHEGIAILSSFSEAKYDPTFAEYSGTFWKLFGVPLYSY